MSAESPASESGPPAVSTCRSCVARKLRTNMCSGSEAGLYLRFIDFVYHSTLGLRVIEGEGSQELANVEFLKGGVAALCPARSTSRMSAESPASESGPPAASTHRLCVARNLRTRT